MIKEYQDNLYGIFRAYMSVFNERAMKGITTSTHHIQPGGNLLQN